MSNLMASKAARFHFLGLGHPRFGIVVLVAGVTVVVHANRVAVRAAQQLPDRHANRLPGDIPQRHLNPANRAHHRALVVPRRRHRAFHIAEELVNVARVLANEGALGEAFVHGNVVDAGPVIGLANAGDPLVGAHLHQHPRHGLQEHGTHIDNFHRDPPRLSV